MFQKKSLTLIKGVKEDPRFESKDQEAKFICTEDRVRRVGKGEGNLWWWSF